MKEEQFWFFNVVIALGVIVVSGCAHGQRGDYREMTRAFDRAAPPQGGPSDAMLLERSDGHLSRASLVARVLERNPSLEAARQAWRAALAKHPQQRALEDLDASYSIAPLSVGSSVVRLGQVVRLEQRFPVPGKLRLAGDMALAEGEAMRDGFEAARRQLAWIASSLFDDYYRVTRSLELNQEHRELMEDIRATAMAQYETGRVSQQDPLQAEVELAHVIHQRVMLRGELAVVIAQINGLLHRAPESTLPPPPARQEPVLTEVPTMQVLQREAVEHRPELLAAEAMLRGAESGLDLAKRDYFPEVGVMGEYNSMWDETQHQWMVGLSLNVPIQIKSRRGAVEQARAEAARADASLEGLTDEVLVHAEQTRQRVIEAQHVIRVYQTRLLPAAEATIEAAKFGYETGRNSFQALIDAERGLRTLQIQYEDAIATLNQRVAELDHARGRLPGLDTDGARNE